MPEDVARLYLITPRITDAESFAAKLETALGAAEMECVLLRVSAADQATAKKIVRALAPGVQARGVACLVEDPQVAVRAGADGAHVQGGGDALEAALSSLKPDKIVGVGGIASRHDAMSAGEADVDYLMFGGPGEAQAFADIMERVAWWAEIFNVPCVAYAGNFEEVAALARVGADFVAICEAVWEDPRGIAAAMRDAALALTKVQEATG